MNKKDLFLKIIKLGFLAASIDKQTVQEEVDIIKQWSLNYLKDVDSSSFNFNSVYNPARDPKKKISDQLKFIYKDLKKNGESYHSLMYEIEKSTVFHDNILNNIPLRYDVLHFILSIIQSDNKITTEEARFIFDLKKSFQIDDNYYTDKVNKAILSISTIELLTDTIDKIYGLDQYNNKKKISSIIVNQYKFWNNMSVSQNKFYRDRGEKILSSLAQLKIKYDV